MVLRGTMVVTARSVDVVVEVGWILSSALPPPIPTAAVVDVVTDVVVDDGAIAPAAAAAAAAASFNRQWTVVMTRGSSRRTVRACIALS